MKPLKLTMNAFGPFVTKQEIDFTAIAGEEIFLVTGETGAGKTTIFDAMSFALYGSASGDSRKPNSFKSDHAASSELCWVEFEFSLRGRKYFLRRYPAQRGTKRDGSPKDIAPGAELILPDGEVVTGATAVTERIEQILGLNHKQFKQTTMLAQGEFRQLIKATGKEKQQIFSKIFGTSIYSELSERLSREELSLQRETQKNRDNIARCIRELAGYGYTALSEPDAAFLSYKQIAELVAEAMSLYEDKSSGLDEDIERLESEKAKLNPEQAKAVNDKLDRRDDLRRINEDLARREPEILEAEKRLARLAAASELVGQEELILATKSQSERYSAEIDELEDRYKRLAEKEQKLLAYQSGSSPEISGLELRISEQESRYNELYRAFLDGQAGILAQNLTSGDACPVCGSVHHPALAAPKDSTPTEKAVNDAKSAVDSLLTQLGRQRDELKKAYWQAKNDCDKCAERLETTIAHRDSLSKQFDSQRAVFVEKLNTSGFSGYKDYRRALDGVSDMPVLKRQTEDYRKRRVEVSAQLAALESDTQNRARKDVDAIIKANDEITRQLTVLRENKAELYAALSGTKNRLDELRRLHEESFETDRKYAIAHELAALAKGSRSVSFERYILAAYFDDIIKLSNIHLQRMTGSRYKLRRLEDPERGAGSGLDMEIIDSYTGKPRDISTLSGGESFKASLALALGLSGVVQIYSGGISIDTMFIDEGFGSLDEKSLDSAVETLISLKTSGRMVGVISHVQGLRGYIPKKLAVRYTPTGSTVAWI